MQKEDLHADDVEVGRDEGENKKKIAAAAEK